MKTETEIENKIKEIMSKNDFTSDNYGSEAADNGIYESYPDTIAIEEAFINFAKWLNE